MMEVNKQSDIQKEYIDKTLEFFKTNSVGYLDLAMRFGKCRTTLEVLKKLYTKSLPSVLICYPDNKLKLVWEEEIEKWGYKNSNISFVNFSSLKNYSSYMFNIIIIDEFHSASEFERDTLKEMLSNYKCKGLALSGTVGKETKQVWGLPLIASYTTEQGIKEGILSNYQITVHYVDLDNTVLEKNKKGKLLTEKQKYKNYTWIIEKIKREGGSFMFIALNRNRLSQASIGKLNYLKDLLESLKDKRILVFTGLSKAADSIGIPSYHSKNEKKSTAFTDFNTGKINHIALAAMGKMGVTYPNLDCVILTNFTYNAEETSQILNRAIKLDYKNKIADLHVIVLNEAPEIKKIKESLSMLDKNKIKYIFANDKK